MRFFKYLCICSLPLIVSYQVHAQDFDKNIQNEKIKIHDCLSNDFRWEITPDSNMYIAFAFKINVKAINNSQFGVVSIMANDTLAYKLFPNYKLLESVDYRIFVKNQMEATLILPVFIDLSDSGKKTQENI